MIEASFSTNKLHIFVIQQGYQELVPKSIAWIGITRVRKGRKTVSEHSSKKLQLKKLRMTGTSMMWADWNVARTALSRAAFSFFYSHLLPPLHVT